MPRRPPTPRPRPPARPLRGPPEETRQRLVTAAATVFNRDGYDGTDSNRLAREAGYAPGTFYKHFADKKQIFLAVYAEWVTAEWRDVAGTLAAGGTAAARADRVVAIFLEHHRKWRRFRASLRALVPVDDEIRAFYRDQRRRQLTLLAELRRGAGAPAIAREDAALLLFTLERASDAVADGEAEALDLRAGAFREPLVA